MTASNFYRSCLELEVASSTRLACCCFRGSANADVVYVYAYDSSGGRSLVGSFGGKDVAHDLYLCCDPLTGLARLWIDGGAVYFEWAMPVSGYTPGAGYTFGARLLGDTDVKDWQVCPQYLRWAAGAGYPPNWVSASGVVGSPSFCVVSGVPYIPSSESMYPPNPPYDEGSLITMTTPSATSSTYQKLYPYWDLNDEQHRSEGTLWTSISSGKLPTIDKYVTSLDVHYDPPGSGDSIIVTPYINGAPQAPALTIDDSYEGNVASLPLYGVRGTEVQLLVQLRSSNGRSTPVFHGASLRFSPLDNSYYLLRLDLREARRDNSNLPFDTEADIAFLKELAESKRVVTMTSPVESCRVRFSGLQFNLARTERAADVNPQGIALVKLKRVP